MKHQGRNAVIAALLVSALLITLTPVSALAAKTYLLWVGGVEVTNMKIKGDGWSYNASTNTLTLKNYTYTGPGRKQRYDNGIMDYAGICYDGSETLKIVLTGENSITIEDAQEEKSEIDVLLCRGNLEISGEGSLTLTAGAAGEYNNGIWCGKKITFKGGTVHAAGGQTSYWTTGITADAITIQDGNVHAVGGQFTGLNVSAGHDMSKQWASGVEIGQRVAVGSCGIYTNSLTINGGTIIVESGDAVAPGTIGYSQGIMIEGKTGIINDGTVMITAGKANHESVAFGSTEEIILNGGNITIIGGEIAGTPIGETEADFGSYGIEAKSTIINGGTVKISGNTKAIMSLVKTSLRGTGYTDAAGTEGKTAISAGDQEQKLEFLNIQFPVKMSFGK